MTFSPTTHSSIDQSQTSEIPQEMLSYLRARTRNRLYSFVVRKFLEMEKYEGLTKAKLARRIGKKPEVITRLLGAPGNWGIDTVSDLLIGICDEELDPNSSTINKTPANYTFNPWVEDVIDNQRSQKFKEPTNTDESRFQIISA